MAKKMYLQEDEPKGAKILVFLTEAAVVIAFALFVSHFFFFSSSHQSKSMEPTIPENARIFASRLAYTFSGPERFDVVSFYRNTDSDSPEVLVRRVIALPGETIRIHRGVVYINGEELAVDEYLGEIISDGIAEEEIRLGPNEYFLLGDTPANSEDSRVNTIGIVNRRQIIGRAWMYALNLLDLHFIR